MNRRVVTLVPILLGAAAGALLGLFEVFPTAAPEASAVSSTRGPASRPRSAPPLATSAATPSVSATLAPPLPSSASEPAALASAPGPGASAAPPRARRAFDLAQPTTQETLLAAQIQCNRSSPEDCERAAFALESGSLGVKDPPRARSLRRIALTLYVKQCEAGRALACTRLAEMYEVGDIVQANPRNAQALRTRVAELCARRPSDSGCLP